MPETETGRKHTLIGPQSLVPLGVASGCVVSLLGFALGFYMWLDARFDGMTKAVFDVSGRVDIGLATLSSSVEVVRQTQSQMEEVLSDRVTLSQLESWAELFFARNPELVRVPVR